MDIFKKIENREYESKYNRKEDPKRWIEDNTRLRRQFEDDAIEFAGLKDSPRATQAFDIAWDDSHSEGLRAVVKRLEQLSELIN